jgi:nucleoside-diphosphate-sugar epimerase
MIVGVAQSGRLYSEFMGREKMALVTGSGGLIGSECARVLCQQGWNVVGIDNDMRSWFFGEAGSTAPVAKALQENFSTYRHASIDIRDRQAIRDLFEAERPDFIIHTAAQPSHDKAASVPYENFDVNAVGTVSLLVAAREFCRANRIGDHICYFSDLTKIRAHFPNWRQEYRIRRIVEGTVQRYAVLANTGGKRGI